MNAVSSCESSALAIAALTKLVNGSKFVDLEQRSQAWFDWRNGKDLMDGAPRITGTAAGVIYGNNPFRTKHGLWRDLMGMEPPIEINFAMQRGIDLEDPARLLYIAYTGNQSVPMCTEHPTIPWVGSSLDGVDPVAGELILEIKCVGKKTHAYAAKGVLPDYYVPQVQWQLLSTPSAKEVHYWSIDAEEVAALLKSGATIETHLDVLLSHCKCVIVKPDLELQGELLRMAVEFRQHLIDGTPPAGDAWMTAARHYVLAKQAVDEAAELLKTSERQLLELVPEEKRNVDGAKVDGGGVCVTYYEADGSVDYPKLVKDLGVSDETLAGYRKASSIRKRISLTGEVSHPEPNVRLASPGEVVGDSARNLDQW